MQIYNCDQKWPICLFDYTYKNKIPTYFCFKVELTLDNLLVPDYFSELNLGNINFRSKKSKEPIPINTHCNLLMERNAHICH